MSGHSKWSTIKRAKGAADVKRGLQFSKLSRAISVAAKDGGADPAGNPRLRLAIDAARAASMPKDNITRAIERATAKDAASIDEVMYEGYGPGGAAILVQALTDNRNRTSADVRSLFNKYGGNMGDAGSVAWMFQSQGVITVELTKGVDADEVSMAAIESGANDLTVEDGRLIILTDPANMTSVGQAMEVYGSVQAELTLQPTAPMEIDAEAEQKLVTLMDILEEHDDVDQVSTNAILSDA
jgi:YebC/PmpR family DNA-binding regulatory protein